MIDRFELEKIRKQRGLSLYQAEKEYFLTIFLFSISKISDRFIFKGGSCLRLIHGYVRFSEDLDFNAYLSVKDIEKIVRKGFSAFTELGIEYEVINEELFESSFTMKIRFKGPLYVGRRDSTNTVRIDVGKRKTKLTKLSQLQKMYPDIPAFFIKSMDKKEILVEKLLAIFSRSKGRDLYDIYYLLEEGIELDLALLKKKLAEQKLKLDFKIKCSRMKYEDDIKKLVIQYPSYDEILSKFNKDILSKIKRL
ncbi:MAG: nucleotidyl transferase AbiEii/AbiGii toxin family protein [DPANN group archaeon]|nr:nucleotidyl transferase AbiEii/AbiGii toxin family protein [DPANN group archaeon]